MGIHIKPETSSIRVFADDCCYENKDRFTAVMTVHHIGDDAVFVCALHGTITRKTYIEIHRALKDIGINRIEFERHGRKESRNTLQ
jgi:hypothetical protein